MTEPKFSIGDRIVVAVPDANREQWNTTALEVMQGAIGVVESVATCERMTGHPFGEPCYLVEFSPSLAPTWKWISATTGHHFDESELRAVEEAR